MAKTENKQENELEIQEKEPEIREEVNDRPEAEKTVRIRLPKDKEHKEPVWVRVNERKWLIQRGVEVEVPQCVYEVLTHQEEMEAVVLAFEEANAH